MAKVAALNGVKHLTNTPTLTMVRGVLNLDLLLIAHQGEVRLG
ncbi:hypothetical protein SPWS13_0039 [Shewanella putrefaciens]|nr:hypothetical protein SPWS13_0039 [Shewanella putrefaciens]